MFSFSKINQEIYVNIAALLESDGSSLWLRDRIYRTTHQHAYLSCFPGICICINRVFLFEMFTSLVKHINNGYN